jgi:hypothetical protein
VAHLVAVGEHVVELHVGQAAHGGVRHVGAQRAARVDVLEQEGDRVRDVHLVPDADAHRRPFLGVDRLRPQVLLIEAEVEGVAAAEPVDDERRHAEPGGQEVQPRLVDDAEDLAEQHVDLGLALADDNEPAEHSDQGEQDGHGDEQTQEGERRGDEEGHDATSRKTRLAFS